MPNIDVRQKHFLKFQVIPEGATEKVFGVWICLISNYNETFVFINKNTPFQNSIKRNQFYYFFQKNL